MTALANNGVSARVSVSAGAFLDGFSLRSIEKGLDFWVREEKAAKIVGQLREKQLMSDKGNVGYYRIVVNDSEQILAKVSVGQIIQLNTSDGQALVGYVLGATNNPSQDYLSITIAVEASFESFNSFNMLFKDLHYKKGVIQGSWVQKGRTWEPYDVVKMSDAAMDEFEKSLRCRE